MLRAVYLDFRSLPPTPERLMTFPALCLKFGVDTLYLDWGGTFPWSLDGDFLKDTYTEDLIFRFAGKLRESGIKIYSAVRLLDGLLAGTGNSRLTHLRVPPRDRKNFKATARAFLKSAEDIRDDLVSLIPGMSGVYLGGDSYSPRDVSPEEQIQECIAPVLSVFEKENVTPVLSGSLLTRAASGAARSLDQAEWLVTDGTIPPGAGENRIWRYTADSGMLENPGGGEKGIVGTVPFPECCPEAAFGFYSEGEDPPVFRGFREFHRLLDAAWRLVRRDREELTRLSFTPSPCPEHSLPGDLEEGINGCSRKAEALRSEMEGIIQEDALRLYCASRVFPLEEELSSISVRRRHLLERS
jgi:hypothetical protein